MKNGKNLFEGLSNLKGAKFISLNNYSAVNGEIANHTILTNISVMNAKLKDLNTLKTAVISELDLKKIALDVFSKAHGEMLTSAIKNTSEKKEERTNQSQAQTDAYLSISNAIKIHKETGNIHIFGMANQKKVLVEGTPKKPVNSSDKTIAKKMITKQLNLRAGKFRTFILDNVKSVNMEGETININC